MFWDILSSRGLIAGFVFFVMIVSGSLLYSWHVRRASEAEFQRSDSRKNDALSLPFQDLLR